MLVVVSPAKALNFDPAPEGLPATQPALMAQTRELMKTTRHLTRTEIAGLMDLSDKLSDLNHDRFRAFRLKHTNDNAKQAALAFAGDTYRGLDAGSLDREDLDYAQDHLRILSGLYGVFDLAFDTTNQEDQSIASAFGHLPWYIMHAYSSSIDLLFSFTALL